MKKHLGTTEVNMSNRSRKVVKAVIWEHEGKYYISAGYHRVFSPTIINGKEYTEVVYEYNYWWVK